MGRDSNGGDGIQYEFREDTRTSLEVPVTLLIAGQKTTEAKTANISMGGFFVALLKPPPVGTMVRFALDLDPKVVRGFSAVVWVRKIPEGLLKPAGMGLRFRHFVDDGEAVLRERLGS